MQGGATFKGNRIIITSASVLMNNVINPKLVDIATEFYPSFLSNLQLISYVTQTGVDTKYNR